MSAADSSSQAPTNSDHMSFFSAPERQFQGTEELAECVDKEMQGPTDISSLRTLPGSKGAPIGC